MNCRLIYEADLQPVDQEAVTLGIEAIGTQIRALGGLTVAKTAITEGSLPAYNTNQVDASQVLDGVSAFPGGGLFVVATSRDLGHRNVNYLFGLSREGAGKIIVSTRRLQGKAMAVMGVTAHELGHALGLVAANQPQYDAQSYFPGHCKNVCLMQPVNSIPEMESVSVLMSRNRQTAGFCSDCSGWLQSLRIVGSEA